MARNALAAGWSVTICYGNDRSCERLIAQGARRAETPRALATHADVIHIAVATGSVPTKGLSLPFVSAGGSNLFFTLLAGGILINIARSEETPTRFGLVAWHRDIPDYEHMLRQSVRSVGAVLRDMVTNSRGR